MTDVLVTGATGTVGHPIARKLVERGHTVRALVRSPERAAGSLPPGVEIAAGDLGDRDAVRAAVEGASIVYHAAGMPEQWRLDNDDFIRVNVDGTRNMVEAAAAAEVERFVYTSTIDVFKRSPGVPFDEAEIDPDPQATHYERSKQEADRVVVAAAQRGLDAVFLHPSGVYGPVPALNPGANELIADLARGKVPLLLPGGLPVVYNEDVADGHLLAAENARAGARFILSDSHLSLVEIAEIVRSHRPDAKIPRVMPIGLARAIALAGHGVARVTRKPPLIPRGALHFLESHVLPIADRARKELGWTPTPATEGIGLTLAEFHERGWITA